MGSARDGTPATGRTKARKSYRQWSKAVENVFFETLSTTANVQRSCESCGMSNSAAYQRRGKDPVFRARWLAALASGYARLETVMLDRAINGYEKVVQVCGPDGELREIRRTHQYSHAMAIRMLQMHRKEVEGYRALEQVRGGREDDEKIKARILAELARVRGRLIPLGTPVTIDAQPGEQNVATGGVAAANAQDRGERKDRGENWDENDAAPDAGRA